MKLKQLLKKGQAAFFVTFIVAILLGVFVLVQFTNTLEVTPQEGESQEEAAQKALEVYADLVKKSVTDILALSTKRALYDSARDSIDAPNNYFISYGVGIMPELEQAKQTISHRSLAYCNLYLDDLEGEQYGSIEFKDSGALSKIDIWVDNLNLNDGSSDESFLVSGQGGSQAGPTLTIEPISIELQQDSLQEFSVHIFEAQGVYGTQFDIVYDPAVLEFVQGSVSEGTFLSQDSTGTFFAGSSGEVFEPGRINAVSLTRIGDVPGAHGQGDLITLDFKAIGTDASTTSIVLDNVKVLSRSLSELSFSEEESFVTVSSEVSKEPIYSQFFEDATIKTSYTIDGEEVSQEIPYAFSTEIQNNRYWYLYRTIKSWVDQDVLTQSTCNHLPIVKGNASNEPGCFASVVDDSVVNAILDESINKLQSKFDGDISCSYEILCQFVESEVHWKVPCDHPCGEWGCRWYESNVSCASGGCGSEVDCENPTNYDAPPCQDEKLTNYSSKWEYGTGLEIFASELTNGQHSTVTYSTSHEVKFTANISCTDNKFTFLPEDPYQHLSFDFLTHINMIRSEDPDDPPCPCDAAVVVEVGAAPQPSSGGRRRGGGGGSSPPSSPG